MSSFVHLGKTSKTKVVRTMLVEVKRTRLVVLVERLRKESRICWEKGLLLPSFLLLIFKIQLCIFIK